MLPRLLLVVLMGSLLGTVRADEPKAKKNEKRSGTVVGTVTAKEKNWIEVKADGEEKARRYVPYWRGGAPNAGGGPDKEMVKQIAAVKVGSRVRLEWEFEERPRVVKLDVLKPAAGAARDAEPERKGTVTGTVTGKASNWIEIKADGEEKGRKYYVYRGGTAEIKQAIQETPTGSRVRIEWLFSERPRVMKLEVLKKAAK
jgi:hypothetical protein